MIKVIVVTVISCICLLVFVSYLVHFLFPWIPLFGVVALASSVLAQLMLISFIAAYIIIQIMSYEK